MIVIGRSFCVLSAEAAPSDFLPISFTARENADLMTPRDLRMPMMPAVAMPPIPIGLAYVENISSALIDATEAVRPVFIRSITLSPPKRLISGISTNQTRKLPQQMMREYFNPII